jgi:hypothetical protein
MTLPRENCRITQAGGDYARSCGLDVGDIVTRVRGNWYSHATKASPRNGHGLYCFLPGEVTPCDVGTKSQGPKGGRRYRLVRPDSWDVEKGFRVGDTVTEDGTGGYTSDRGIPHPDNGLNCHWFGNYQLEPILDASGLRTSVDEAAALSGDEDQGPRSRYVPWYVPEVPGPSNPWTDPRSKE